MMKNDGAHDKMNEEKKNRFLLLFLFLEPPGSIFSQDALYSENSSAEKNMRRADTHENEEKDVE